MYTLLRVESATIHRTEFTESRADRRAGQISVEISGPFHETSFGGNIFAMLWVDDCSPFKSIRFLRHKSDATEALRRIIDEEITPAGLEVWRTPLVPPDRV